MSITQWALTAGAKGVIRDAEKDGRIKEACSIADGFLKGFFPDDPKGVKQMLVQYVIFPFCKFWMKDDPDGFAKAKAGM
jgi:hypothetical protein